IGVLSVSGLSFSLGMSIAASAGQSLPILLLITALTAIVFGMGMPTTAVYILMATLLAPVLVLAGVEPLAAHLFVLYFGVLSMITPPVCIASFAAASMAGAKFMRTGVESLRFGIVAFIVPFLLVASPSLLLTGDTDWVQAGIAMSTAIFGCFLLAAGFEAYLFKVLNWPRRMVAVVAGLLLMFPESGNIVFIPGFPTDQVGFVMAVALMIWNWQQARKIASLKDTAPI
ncbi:MAG: TRAP transporter large permease subunit, partial [Natronospirillum sp.]